MTPNTYRTSILVVDDDPVIRRVVAMQVEQLGHRVFEANSGRQALAILAEQTVDAVLLDVVMPDMSGLDVLHRIKADRKTEGLPVLIMTGLADQDLRLSALGLGAEELLSKPVDRLELGARLRNILKLKALVDQVGKRSGGADRGDTQELQVQRAESAAWRALGEALASLAKKEGMPRIYRLDAEGRLPSGVANATFLSDLGADLMSRDRLIAVQAGLRQGMSQSTEVTLTGVGRCTVQIAPMFVESGPGDRRVGAVAVVVPLAR